MNHTHYIFILSVINYINGDKKQTYIFFRKTIEEIDEMIIDREYGAYRKKYKYKSLINEMDDIQVMTHGAKLKTLKLLNIYQYQIKQELSMIKISFEQLIEINCQSNFVAMVY